MPAVRLSAKVRRLAFFNTLLLGAAFTVPAFGQIETVVVTASTQGQAS